MAIQTKWTYPTCAVNTARSSVVGNNPDIVLIQDITITGSNILPIIFSMPLRPGSRDFYLNIYNV